MTMLRSWGALLSLLALVACASLPPQADRAPTHAYTDTDNTRLGVAFQQQASTHPGQDAFHLLTDPVDALDARVCSPIARTARSIFSTTSGMTT